VSQSSVIQKLVHSVHGAVYIFPLAVISTLVTNMSTAIIRHFDAARAAISAERNCRAQGAAKLNARFAAVMGASVDSILGDFSASSLSASATGYQRLKEYLKAQGLDKAARIQVRLEVRRARPGTTRVRARLAGAVIVRVSTEPVIGLGRWKGPLTLHLILY
jgi:phenylacetate-coenzyme A ligase PaaK-like adenylate-forming protein